MARAALPFLIIPDELLRLSPWRVVMNETTLQDPDLLEGWDNATDLEVERDLELRLPDAAHVLGLPGGWTGFEAVLFVGTGGTSLPFARTLRWRAPLDAEGRAAIHAPLPGAELADVLHLDLALVLREPAPENSSPPSPRRRGDILWRERRRIRLEGDRSRFPVSEVDLGAVLGAQWAGALWALHADLSDLAAPMDSAVRRLINSGCPEFAERVRSRDPSSMQAMMADVLVQLVRGVLKNADFDELGPDEPASDSISSVVREWVRQAFGSVDVARDLLAHDPGNFHAALNALADVSERGA